MLFGQSVFQSVVTRLDEEAREQAPAHEAGGYRVVGFKSGLFGAGDPAAPDGPARAGDAYLDILADAPPPEPELPEAAAPPSIPDHLLRLSEPEIAADLALSPNETVETLAEKRRRFAKDNHPDLVPEELRDNATLRMKTANLLIDRAVKDLYWRSS